MKLKKTEAENTKRAMSQIFKEGRVIVAHDDVFHIISPEALAKTHNNKMWMGGRINIRLDEDVTPAEFGVFMQNMMDQMYSDMPSEDEWPSEDIFTS